MKQRGESAWLTGTIQMTAGLRSSMISNGGQSVMTVGMTLTRGSFVDSLDTRAMLV